MNVTPRTTPVTNTRPGSPAAPCSPGSPDDRSALLTALSELEAELAKRYTSDPVAALADFGLAPAEPVFGGSAGLLVIEQLDGPAVAFDECFGCATTMGAWADADAQGVRVALA
ncbi:hypothetical protein SLA_3078 [Streptomyces laurentii]|uniref:Uncharacterized protein n=1 Tax=Streptomyces laurentii TaxID=39478 RepID=A0A169NIF8_STRLU|nr:hypothetical protein SLA_3078 [Streptomyces laurentii]